MTKNLTRLADAAPPFDPTAVPEQVVLTSDRARLRFVWPGGRQAEIGAGRLRAACRCAWCTRARLDESFAASSDAASFDGVTIERLNPIGGYAVNIAFSDGHARGVYPWTFLLTLAREPHAGASPDALALSDGTRA
jgi:prepilin-type processing-associated H-X9-DG protein